MVGAWPSVKVAVQPVQWSNANAAGHRRSISDRRVEINMGLCLEMDGNGMIFLIEFSYEKHGIDMDWEH